VLAGGWVADRTERHAAFAAACFVVAAVSLGALALPGVPVAAVAALLAVAGFVTGAVAPSRDMLVRAMAPPGDVGKVFGFVSTGFNIGGMVAPPLFGYVLDRGDPRLLFVIAAAVSLATVVTVLDTGRLAEPAPREKACRRPRSL